MPKYSVIVPCYNVEKYICDFLRNIPINRNDFEMIFVDDCSTDNTLKIIKDFVKKNDFFYVIELEKNIGAGLAILKGIDKMKTNWFAHLDPDDIVFPEYFEEIPKFTNNGNITIRFKFNRLENNKVLPSLLAWKFYFKSSWGWSCLINFAETGKPHWTRRMYYDDLYLFSSIYKNPNKKTSIFINKYLATYRYERDGAMTWAGNVSRKSVSDLKTSITLYKHNKNIKIGIRKIIQLISLSLDYNSRLKKLKK